MQQASGHQHVRKIQLHGVSPGREGPPAGFRALLPCVLLPAAARRDRQGLAAALLAGHAPGETLGIVLGVPGCGVVTGVWLMVAPMSVPGLA